MANIFLLKLIFNWVFGLHDKRQQGQQGGDPSRGD